MTNIIIKAVSIILLALMYSMIPHTEYNELGSLNDSEPEIYEVAKFNKALKIDADWNKPEWQQIKPIRLENYMGAVPPFRPGTEVKMMYDDDNVYVIFKVQDRYVKSQVRTYNGPVSGDSCVEFFFAPDTSAPEHYFNLEVNAGGTPLLYYVTKPWTEFVILDSTEIAKIEIAHSLPSVVIPEIRDDVTWTIEYQIPLSVLRLYSDVTQPDHDIMWKANFYKTGSRTSNPHWISWSLVDYPRPNFHLPQYFGTLIFD